MAEPWSSAAILNLGYARSLQGVRQILNLLKISLYKSNISLKIWQRVQISLKYVFVFYLNKNDIWHMQGLLILFGGTQGH
jgi:hypothetical protein